MVPLPASTVMPVRDTRRGLEVLMVRRPETGSFPGMWVFPGGKVDPDDRSPTAAGVLPDGLDPDEAPWRAAALRELAEEVGVFLTDPRLPHPPVGARGVEVYRRVAAAGARLAVDRLVYLSNWVTPEGAPARFDTRFYLARVPADADAAPVDGEVVELAWVEPGPALHRASTGDWPMILPTVKHLELLADHRSVDTLADSTLGWGPEPVEPRMVTAGGRLEVLLPGDPGYEEAGR